MSSSSSAPPADCFFFFFGTRDEGALPLEVLGAAADVVPAEGLSAESGMTDDCVMTPSCSMASSSSTGPSESSESRSLLGKGGGRGSLVFGAFASFRFSCNKKMKLSLGVWFVSFPTTGTKCFLQSLFSNSYHIKRSMQALFLLFYLFWTNKCKTNETNTHNP